MPEELSRQAPGQSSQDSSHFHTPVHPAELKTLNTTGEMLLLRADRSPRRDAEMCPHRAIVTTALSLCLCQTTQLAQGLTAGSSGEVKVMSVTHGCIKEGSARKDGVFVESLLHVVRRQNRDRVRAYSLEQPLYRARQHNAQALQRHSSSAPPSQ